MYLNYAYTAFRKQGFFFLKDLLQKKVCIAFSRTSYKTIPLSKLNKYLYNDKSEKTAPAGPAKPPRRQIQASQRQ